MQAQQVTDTQDFTECDTFLPVAMTRLPARDRFVLRVRAILDEKKLPQKAARGSNSEEWISTKLSGARNLQLNEAEEIADALQVPLAELLRKPEDSVYELDNMEARLIEAYRQLSKPEQDAFVLVMTLRHRPAPYASGRKVALRAGTSSQPGGAPRENALSARRAAAADAEDIRALIQAFDQRLAEALRQSGGQTPGARVEVPHPSKHR